MAFVHIPNRWKQQPQVAVEVADEWRQHMATLYNFGALGYRGFDAANKYSGLRLTSLDATSKSAFKAVNGNPVLSINTGNDASVGFLVGVGSGNFVVPSGPCAAFAYGRVTGTTCTFYGNRASGSGTPIIDLSVGANGIDTSSGKFIPLCRDDASGLTSEATGITVNDGAYHLLVAQRNGTNWQWSVDGSAPANFSSSSTNGQGAITFTMDYMAVGGERRNSSLVGPCDTAMAGLMLNRCFTSAELKSLNENPWQLYQPIRRKLFFNTAAAGGTFKPFWAVQNNSVVGAGVH